MCIFFRTNLWHTWRWETRIRDKEGKVKLYTKKSNNNNWEKPNKVINSKERKSV